ncbi:hypothetical protein ACFSUK_24500 [Sphingobium scionense]
MATDKMRWGEAMLMETDKPGAATEWRRHYMLPIAALGYATSVIHIYGLGPYIQPISDQFGWTRTQVTVGLTLSTLVQAVFPCRSA